MGKHSKYQIAAEYAAARALISGLGVLPRSWAVATGRGLGRMAYMFAGGLRRTGERNLELAFPEMSAVARAAVLRGCFRNLGRLLGEFTQFPRHTPASIAGLVEYDGIEYLHQGKARGKGVIFLTSHLGAWEILSFAHSALYEPLSFLVRPIDNPRIEELVENYRTRFGNQPIDKKAAVRTALRVLREGGTLGILADLNTQQQEGVFVPFFGHLACTTAGVAALALRTDAAVIPVCAPWHEERQRFVFHGDPPMEVIRTGDYQQDIEINTARYTAAIERHVRAFPEQWLWIHKRWNTRPPGEPDLYARGSATQLASAGPATPASETTCEP